MNIYLFRRKSLMLEPRCYNGSPKVPDQNEAAIAGAQADLANYPQNYMVNALAQMGGRQTINGKTYDFTGQGNADQSAKMSDQMAQALLDIQKNYGADYVKQRLADLQQSDPAGYAARKQLFDSIIADSNANPNRPMATALQSQVNDMLGTAGQLDQQALQEVQQGVRGQQQGRGITLGNAPANEENMAVVGASDNLRSQQQQAAQQYLSSGISPEDVTYRRIQQSLSNLGAFQNNQTPEAQFGQLSGAQNGAAPFNPVNYQNPASTNPGSAAQGLGFANSIYATNTGYAESQANPWLTGLSTGINAAGAFGNMGAFGNGPNSTWSNLPNRSQLTSFTGGAGPVAAPATGGSFQMPAFGNTWSSITP